MADRSERTRVRVARVRKRPRSFLRRWRWWLLGLVFVLLVLLGISGVRYYAAFKALDDGRTRVLAARQLLTGDLAHLDRNRVDQARAELQSADADFGDKSALVADGLLARVAAHLPGISAQVNTARALRIAGASGTRLGIDLLQLLQDVVPSGGSASSVPPFQRLVSLASGHRDEVNRVSGDVQTFRQTLATIPIGPVLSPLERARATVLGEGTKLANSAGPALGILQALPAAIGPGEHRYLLLLENPGEERPGGGFIGAVGEVAFRDGVITSLDFRGSEYYTPLVRNIPAPAPLDRYLFHGEHWELGDANWSPDFPTSAAEVERFYTAGTGARVDGVIDADPVALGYLLAVLGPVRVAPYPQTITAANVLTELNYIANSARPQDPGKVFLPPFGALLVRSLLQAPVAQMPPLSDALQHGAREKHIVLFFHDAQLQALVDHAGYGGRVQTPFTDSILVDDANLSGTKGDLYVKRDMHLTATVSATGDVKDQLVLNYRNPRATNAADQALLKGSGGEYRDYVRAYLPETAQLGSITVSISGRPAAQVPPDAVTYELGREAVAYWLIVPYAGSAQVTLNYSGPFADISVTPERYELAWMKQVNALTWPVEATVTMPDGRRSHWSAPLVTDKAWSAGG